MLILICDGVNDSLFKLLNSNSQCKHSLAKACSHLVLLSPATQDIV